jgi:transglutaminase-like putative cysteine protease
MSKGYARVDEICEWINRHINYVPGTTNASSTACDVLLQRTGVCRDFAHVGIALCRSLCIPARYVSGYAAGLEPQDFHGCFEAFLGNRWYLFDATRKAPVDGFVRIGFGRDAADVPVANIVGLALLQSQTVSAVESTPRADVGSNEDLAISTA